MIVDIYVCPTCRNWKWLEVYDGVDGKICYCRRCEEGCIVPVIAQIERDDDQSPSHSVPE